MAQPGLLVTIMVGQGSGQGRNDIHVDTRVSVNSGCRTEYSTQVALGPMASVVDATNEVIGAEQMATARRDLLQEMATRAESIGPAGILAIASDSEDIQNDVGHDVQERDDDVNNYATQDHGQPAGRSREGSEQDVGEGVDGNNGSVNASMGTIPGLKDEHDIEDMYS